MATAEAVKVPDKTDEAVRELCKHLAYNNADDQPGYPVYKLPEALRKDAVLARAFAEGLIEIGRRGHTITNRIHHEKDEIGIDRVVKTPKFNVENEYSWMDKAKAKADRRKSIREIIAEDNQYPDEKLKARVRLTDDGQARA